MDYYLWTCCCCLLIVSTACLQEGDAGRPNTVFCKNRGFFQGQEDAHSGYKDERVCVLQIGSTENYNYFVVLSEQQLSQVLQNSLQYRSGTCQDSSWTHPGSFKSIQDRSGTQTW